MFGLTFEKMLLVLIVAGVIIGPQRLPAYAQQFAGLVRNLQATLKSARTQAATELGVSSGEWQALDYRRYHPRTIVRDALAEPATPIDPVAVEQQLDQVPVVPEASAEAEKIRPGQRYLVTGSAAHPQRVAIDSLPTDDPRRRAARLLLEVHTL